uniref:PiHTL-A n=1 Tax=Petunia integrifolia subsp. inflata TaxID=212142 RepID=Q2PHE6_PETIN|nr:PiHTL-A [Petunia integrifolia subsp. inflata]BAE75846.1 PiHTL-A [Petunia integrifolia subsp. inflata]BAH56519.1 PiHTL-A [Petunia integrifolia subsp. inflata]
MVLKTNLLLIKLSLFLLLIISSEVAAREITGPSFPLLATNDQRQNTNGSLNDPTVKPQFMGTAVKVVEYILYLCDICQCCTPDCIKKCSS